MQYNLMDNSQRYKKIIFSPIFAFILFAIFMFILFNKVLLMPGDDSYFAQMHLQYNLFDYLGNRYNMWSSRLFADTLSYFFTGEFYFLWKWFCTILILVSSFAIYKWVTEGKEMTQARKCLFAYLCCFGFGIINSNVLSPSVFWVTGTAYYMVPFALGVIAFTPFVFTIKNKEYKPKTWLKVVCVICAVFTAFSQEQVAVFLVASAAISLVYLFIKTRRVNWFLFILTIALTVSTLICLAAPSESIRYAANIGTFPFFNILNLQEKVAIMAHFTMNTLINQSYLPLIFLWLTTGWMLFEKKNQKFLRVLAIVSIAFSVIMIVRMINPADSNIFGFFMQPFQKLFLFNYLTSQNVYVPNQIGPYIFWGISLLLIPVNIFFIWGRSKRSFFYILIYIAAIASIILITFTPVLYLSGARTGFLSNMLFLILLYFLLSHFEKLSKLAVLIIFIAVIKLILLLTFWNASGFTLWYGVLDTSSIPFKVVP